MSFDHEKLRVYQDTIRFVAWAQELLEELQGRTAVCDHLDRSATSVALNIAEGNGKFTSPDRCRYLDTARGSALEAAACLDVLVARKCIAAARIREGKDILHGIVSMLVGLIRANSERLYEEPGDYSADVGPGGPVPPVSDPQPQ